MTEGEKPAGMGAGKIVLIIVAVLAGLLLVCCGIAWFTGGTFIKGAIQLGQGSVAMAEDLQTVLGPGTTMQVVADDTEGMVVAVGVKGELTEERVREAQDKAWGAYCKAFEKGGFRVSHVAVGEPVSPGTQNQVRGWRTHMVAVAEVVQRTGKEAPPVNEMFLAIEQKQREAKKESGGDDDGGDTK